VELLVYAGDRVFIFAYRPLLFLYQTFFMSGLDWLVLTITLLGIIAYGLYRSRTTQNLEGYFLCNNTMPWYLVLLSIMGTQASAVTFLAPGQSYTDGMRFVQLYFGLPLAMVVLCITFVPVFHKLKIFTAYEFLEKRFDLKTRTLTSFLFLLQRGLSTGISISVAVMLEEVAHRLGTFAVLIRAGMKMKQSFLYILLCACACYPGLALGIFLGDEAEEASPYIFALAGKAYMYIPVQ